jgi:DNA-directed RNA polymerase subunit RPC12/RpoP
MEMNRLFEEILKEMTDDRIRCPLCGELTRGELKVVEGQEMCWRCQKEVRKYIKELKRVGLYDAWYGEKEES